MSCALTLLAVSCLLMTTLATRVRPKPAVTPRTPPRNPSSPASMVNSRRTVARVAPPALRFVEREPVVRGHLGVPVVEQPARPRQREVLRRVVAAAHTGDRGGQLGRRLLRRLAAATVAGPLPHRGRHDRGAGAGE